MTTTFHERIRKTLAIDPAAPAIEFKGEWRSWGELARVVAGVDAALDQVGAAANAAVGCVLRNTPEHAGAVLAMFASDRCLVTLNPFYPDATLVADIRKIRPPFLLAASQDWAPPGLKEACKHAESIYQRTRSVRVKSEAGTELTYTCGEYPVMTQWGYADERSHFDHWGGGHIHTFPNEGSAHGTVVFQPGDIVILPYCRYVADPVRLEIREGHIVSVAGGMDAKLMRDWLEDGKRSNDDRDPYAVSHLGWGMNPQALWYGIALHGDTPERHRAAARTFPGNFLFSTGPNTQGGGRRDTRGHYDVPMRDCSVELDGKAVIERGRIVDEKMRVARVQR